MQNQNEEYKNKINELNQIIAEKDKNDKLQKDKIKELENEIKKLESYFLQPGEKLLTIRFISTDQIIDHTLYAKDSELFSVLEGKLYSKYPKYAEQENFFLGHGQKINRFQSLKDNGIKNNEILTLKRFDEI